MLTERQGGAIRIVALEARAAALGLAAGMSLADARAMVPQLAVRERDAGADAGLLHHLAELCDAFTPLVARDGTDGLMLDITGCTHLFRQTAPQETGEEAAFCTQLRRRLGRAGVKTRLALAGTPDAARAQARFGSAGIVVPGADGSAGRLLPVAALEMAPETALALSRAGLRTLGQLADRPPQVLAARFGQALVERLRRVLGDEDLRITPLRPPPDCMAERHFPEPRTHLDSLMGVLERLAHDVAGMLENRAAGGRAFEASFFRSDGVVRRLAIETAQATRDVASLMRLIRLRIEALADPLDPGFGFDAVRLAVIRSETLTDRQGSLDRDRQEQGADDRALTGLVDRLAARLGSGNLRCLVVRDTHDPARAGDSIALLAGPATAALPLPASDEPPARPLTLFEPPQPIEALAEVPDGPPFRFRWRRLLHEVASAEGPERIAPEWWREGARAPATRDYYRVENAGGQRFWIFREGLYEEGGQHPRWFLHGLFL